MEKLERGKEEKRCYSQGLSKLSVTLLSRLVQVERVEAREISDTNRQVQLCRSAAVQRFACSLPPAASGAG
eukprot:758768-Hanusia_phi.AAC.5